MFVPVLPVMEGDTTSMEIRPPEPHVVKKANVGSVRSSRCTEKGHGCTNVYNKPFEPLVIPILMVQCALNTPALLKLYSP